MNLDRYDTETLVALFELLAEIEKETTQDV